MPDKPKVWKVCATCGSRNVTNDAIARWCEESQQWEISSLLDNADCDDCGGETNLEEEPILSDADMRFSIKEWGYTLVDEPDGRFTLHVGGIHCRTEEPFFVALTDAYLFALYHEAEDFRCTSTPST